MIGSPIDGRISEPPLSRELPGKSEDSPLLRRLARLGRQVRSIFPDTGFITNFSTRKIFDGTEGGGSCVASVDVTRAAHAAGAGATEEISPWQTEGAATKATSDSF